MKKLLSLLMASVLLLAPAFSLANAQTNNTSTDDTVLYSAEEITDVDALIQRSLAAIDDLQENTGFELTVTATTATPSLFSAYSAEPQQTGEIYVTSQLLRSELVNGEQIDTYAVKMVQTTGQLSGQRSSGALISTMYVNYDSSGAGSAQMINTTAMVTVAGATRLVMTNGFRTGPEQDMITNSSSYANPGAGTYTLNRCSSGWIRDGMGILYLRNNLYYGSNVMTTEFAMTHNAIVLDY